LIFTCLGSLEKQRKDKKICSFNQFIENQSPFALLGLASGSGVNYPELLAHFGLINELLLSRWTGAHPNQA